MTALAEAALSEEERTALDFIVAGLKREFGDQLRSVWLYGSRARGEKPHAESDVDLLVVLDRYSWRDEGSRMHDVIWQAADEGGAEPAFFSAIGYSVDWLANRREIKSFFIQEVDRDKIVLHGEP